MGTRMRVLALLAVAVLAAAGCSNELDTGLTNTGKTQQVQLKKKGDLSFAVVSHGAAGDSFWTVIKNGAKQGLGGTVENLQVEGSNTAQVESTIQAKLQADKSIDGILVLGPIIAGPAIQAVQASGSSAKIATFDLSGEAIQAIEQGKLLFAVDQQQFLQGYLPIQFLYLYATNLNTVGGGLPVLTGPGYVTKDNAARVASLASGGTR